MKNDFYQEAEGQITSGYFSPIEGFEYGASWMRDEAKALVEDIAEQLKRAKESEDWEDVEDVVSNIIPHLFDDYGT